MDGAEYFAKVFKEDVSAFLPKKLKVLSLYPRFFSALEAELIGRVFTLREIESVLRGLPKTNLQA